MRCESIPYVAGLRGSTAPLNLDIFVASEVQSDAICAAISTLAREQDLPAFNVRVINVYTDPATARAEKIQTVPMVVRRSPHPERRIIGKLDDVKYLRMALGLQALTA